MKGLMMDYQLTIPKILERGRRIFPDKEIVSFIAGQKIAYTYAEFYGRVTRLMNVLRKLGVKKGDRVATFGWNHHRHMELYYAVPCLGAVLHTLNIRLFPEQLTFIVNHAEDSIIFVDDSLVQSLEALAGQFKTVKQYVVMAEPAAGAATGPAPDTSLSPVADFEALMAEVSDTPDFPDLEETDASGLCYTSGTTGNPKGVLYSHRAIYLHSLMAGLGDALGPLERDVVLPVVPMFHANAWSIPFTCAMSGSRLVFVGSDVTPENLAKVIAEESVTLALGVTTIWNNLLHHLRRTGGKLETVHSMVVGGAPVPRALIAAFRDEFDVHIVQGWGMTEMSPLGSTSRLSGKMEDWPPEKQLDMMATAGKPGACVEMKIVDEAGAELPWDGRSAGELLVRGPAVVSGYYNNPEADVAFTDDGWFRTGDVATLDENAMLQITDRTKDLIKSGGEWISSVEMENAIMACQGVLESAVVARPDEKWDERPVAFVVRAEDAGGVDAEAILEGIKVHFAKWQLPAKEDIRFVDEIPKTSVGKFDKKVLRMEWAG